MSNELYYRGSSTYEVAVENRLKDIERSNNRNGMAMVAGLQGIRSDIRESTYQIVASQAMLAEVYKQGFDSVNNTLDFGFSRISGELTHLSSSIKYFADEICSKLDEIHDIVNNPLLTACRELYRRAMENFEKTYYEEALEDVQKALEKNRTDAVSWLLLGQLRLFGAGKFSNVINLQEANEALTQAAKYIEADIGKTKEVDEIAWQIYYYLCLAKLYLSNDLLVEDKVSESTEKLEEAEKCTLFALWNLKKSNKENVIYAETLYENAKINHFLGKDEECLENLKTLMMENPEYALKALNDENLKTILPEIEELISNCRDSLSKEYYNEVKALETKLQSLYDKYVTNGYLCELPSYQEPQEDEEDYEVDDEDDYEVDDEDDYEVDDGEECEIDDEEECEEHTFSDLQKEIQTFLEKIDKMNYLDLYQTGRKSITIFNNAVESIEAKAKGLLGGLNYDLKWKPYGFVCDILECFNAVYARILQSESWFRSCFGLIAEQYRDRFKRDPNLLLKLLVLEFEVYYDSGYPNNIHHVLCRFPLLGTCDYTIKPSSEESIKFFSSSNSHPLWKPFLIERKYLDDGTVVYIGSGKIGKVLDKYNLQAFKAHPDVERIKLAVQKTRKNLEEADKWCASFDGHIGAVEAFICGFRGGAGCYIATSVYGSYDCPQVWTLRRFRDYALAKTWHGRAFIRCYYAISPTLVKWFGKTAWFQSMWRNILDRMVSRLKSEGFADTEYEDLKWQ